MELFLAAILASGCTALGVLALHLRRRSTTKTPSSPCPPSMDPRGLEELQPSSMVLYDGLDWFVSGVTRFAEGQEQWQEILLEEGQRVHWLVVHPRDPDHLLLGRRVEDLGLNTAEPSESLDYQGKVYHLERLGQAKIMAEGHSFDEISHGTCRYWDYRRPGCDRLWIRQVREEWICLVGQRVARHLFCSLPPG